MRYNFKLFSIVFLLFLMIGSLATAFRSLPPIKSSSATIQSATFTQTSSKHPGRNQAIVFIQPIFTQAAYGNNDPNHHGFYDYYFGRCNQKCLTVPIPKTYNGSYNTGGLANEVLLRYHYSHITDIDVDKNPSILEKYGTVILLHNEYVTQREFYAITHHPHVVYLFPNSLFAEIKADYNTNTITLVRGHWYPNKETVNGFDWKYDNTRYEDNTDCSDWHFYDIYNGKMLDCYPENIIYFDPSLLNTGLS